MSFFKITDFIDVEDLQKDDPDSHLIRIGWSLKESSLQLGEEKFSYSYCNNARICNDCLFKDYGETFAKEDSIGAYIDFETDQENILIAFSKNGHDLGEAFKVSRNELREYFKNNHDTFVFYPHVLTRNIVYEVNFGQRVSFLGDEPFAPIKTGFELIKKVPIEKRFKNWLAPKEQKDCEILMLVGLPSSGKTYWAKQYSKENPEKCYNILGTSELLNKTRVIGSKKRTQAQQQQQSLKNTSDIFDKIGRCMNRLIEIAAMLKRNIILDQNNVYASARRRKMKLFTGYNRKAVIIIPSDEIYKERLKKSEVNDGKEISMSAIYDMKANFCLPKVGEIFDDVEYVELKEEYAKKLIEDYNIEGPSCRMQLILNKRIKTDEEKKQLNIKLNAMRLIRPGYGYGYGREKALSRNSGPPYGKRSYQPYVTNRQPTPLMTNTRSGYQYSVSSQVSGWNPLVAPATPYGMPSYGMPYWSQNLAYSSQVSIQQHAQSQWTPAMSTNVTNSLLNDSTRLPPAP